MRTIKEAAPLMGLEPRAVYARITKRQIPGAVKVRGRWMIPDSILTPFAGTMTVTQAARYLKGVIDGGSRQSIYNWVREGRLQGVRDSVGILRVKKSELDELAGISARKGD